MRRFRQLGNKIPKSIVRRGRLRHLIIWLRLYRMDQVGEFNGVLDKKYWHVITNQVKVSLLGIKLHGEPAHITRQICRPPGSCNS
ncbi:hypothetical protein D3C85_1699020 [compost metagenome]